MFLRGIEKAVTVEVSPREMRVRRRCLMGSPTEAIPSEELEELVLIGHSSKPGKKTRRLAARSDELTLEFGHGLSEGELTWLRAVIWNVVSA